MRYIAGNTLIFTRAFTLIFLLVVSGLIGVFHICAERALECRDPSSATSQNACPNKQPLLHMAGMSVHNMEICKRNTVVGGFHVFRALLEKDCKAQIVEVRSLPIFTFDSPEPINSISWFNYSYSESVSLPSVEKYVLNATLLI